MTKIGVYLSGRFRFGLIVVVIAMALGVTACTERESAQTDKTAIQVYKSPISSHQAAAAKEITLLTQSLEKADRARQEIKDQVTRLTDENRILLQEKAMIQGQLKQLQNAMTEAERKR